MFAAILAGMGELSAESFDDKADVSCLVVEWFDVFEIPKFSRRFSKEDSGGKLVAESEINSLKP